MQPIIPFLKLVNAMLSNNYVFAAYPILSHGPIGSESWATVPKGGISMGLMMKILFMHTNTYLNDDIVKILSLSSAETKQYTILKPGIIL